MATLSKHSATVPIGGSEPAERTRWVKAQELNWGPVSESITVPLGCRLLMAMPSAVVIRLAAGAESIDHPTTWRLEVSATTTQ
jgi:hypothetical protein